jgi:hypothetical protein
MTSRPYLQRGFSYWWLWLAFAALTIYNGFNRPDPVRHPERYPWHYPWHGVLVGLAILAAQTALIRLILGRHPDQLTGLRVIGALLYTAPIAVLFFAQLFGDPGPNAPYVAEVPILYAILLLLLSVAGLILFLTKATRRALQ